MNKSWISYLLIFLLTINLAALGTIIYFSYLHNKIEHNPNPVQPILNGSVIMDSLKLSPQQSQKFDDSRMQFRERSRPFMQEMHEKKQQIIEKINQDDPDTLELNKLAEEMGKLNAELKKNAIRHFIEMRNACTPEQKLIMKELSRNMFRAEEPGGRGMQYRHGWKDGKRPESDSEQPPEKRHGKGHGKGQGMGQGNGQGNGQGMGQGKGPGMGQGRGQGRGPGGGQGRGTGRLSADSLKN